MHWYVFIVFISVFMHWYVFIVFPFCSSNDSVWICHKSDETSDPGHSWQWYVTILMYMMCARSHVCSRISPQGGRGSCRWGMPCVILYNAIQHMHNILCECTKAIAAKGTLRIMSVSCNENTWLVFIIVAIKHYYTPDAIIQTHALKICLLCPNATLTNTCILVLVLCMAIICVPPCC